MSERGERRGESEKGVGANARLRSAAIWLPVAVEFLVSHVGFVLVVNSWQFAVGMSWFEFGREMERIEGSSCAEDRRSIVCLIRWRWYSVLQGWFGFLVDKES